MKKKIAVLGSTGSIGQNTLKVLEKNIKDFEIVLLSTNRNIKKIFQQVKKFKVKNIIISDKKKYFEAKNILKKNKVNIYNNYEIIDKILKRKKLYYSMIAISGIEGLKPTLKFIKNTKNLAIVNKESIICGWNLIQRDLIKYKTNFIPIDSEHFSIFSLLQNNKINQIEKIFITASGGPFINFPLHKFNQIKLKDALKHPNWKMGKKITIDSATLMNKVFEVIEAKNIFNIDYKKISILTHPKSYIHAIIKFHDGLIKILVHEPDMKIPIYNSIYLNKKKKIQTQSLNLDILNNLQLKKVDKKKFPLVKLLKNLPNESSLFETVLITLNDYFVFKFLEKKIDFRKLIYLINKASKFKEFQKFKQIKPRNIDDIYRVRDYVSFKMDSFSI